MESMEHFVCSAQDTGRGLSAKGNYYNQNKTPTGSADLNILQLNGKRNK